MIGSRIAGIGSYVPERKITNDDVLSMLIERSSGFLSPADLEKLLGKAKHKLAKSGNDTRFWCKENQYCTDIAREASKSALQSAGIDAKDLDLVIFTGMSKAFIEPATAHVLRHEIGATRANVFDTQDACTSVMKSLEIANALIQTGRYKKVLIACGERSYDWADFACKTVEELSWKFGALTIGDAAAAVVLEATEDPQYTQNARHMRFFYRIMDGTYPTCHIGLNHRIGDRYHLYSNASLLIRTGLTAILELLSELYQDKEWFPEHYDTLFIHDIGQIIEELVIPNIKAAGIHVPETYKSYYPKFGNVASASFPLCMSLARDEGRMKRGDLCVFVCPAAGVQGGIMSFVY